MLIVFIQRLLINFQAQYTLFFMHYCCQMGIKMPPTPQTAQLYSSPRLQPQQLCLPRHKLSKNFYFLQQQEQKKAKQTWQIIKTLTNCKKFLNTNSLRVRLSLVLTNTGGLIALRIWPEDCVKGVHWKSLCCWLDLPMSF